MNAQQPSFSVAFDEASHTYWINGTKVSGVTELLQMGGVANGLEFVSEEALWRGKIVHQAIHFYHKGTLDWNSVDDQIRPYLSAYLEFMKDTGFCPVRWEQRLGNPLLGFAGTFDVEGVCHGEKWLIDFKSALKTRSIAPWVGVQLAGYDMLLGPSQPPRRRFGLKLMANGLYDLKPFADPADYAAMLGCINVSNWRKRHERK